MPALELKHTLNLPRTSFPMKANLPLNEPKMLAHWQEIGIYSRIRKARSGAQVYVLHDGPPYANGPVHLGTALNKCLKDFVVKSKTMAGFNAPYVPGWDCHGLPIEIKVDEALGRRKLELEPGAVRQKCREYATQYLNVQREQFKRLGVFGRWDEPYMTMTPQYEAVIASTLFQFLEQGLVYKGLKPVYWCIRDKTALAEAEVEYENHTSPSIWVKYALASEPEKIDAALTGRRVATIIWTTTPWTLPASMAVAFQPQLEYVALESRGEVFIVAEKLAAPTISACHLEGSRVVARFPGSRMERARFAHPFLERSILGVLADYVTTDQGTGAVHTAPSHGAEDFYTGARYGLDQSCNVDESGRLRNGLPEYEGKTVFQANQPILELLRARGALLAASTVEHSYPHCWRCHQPVIFRATEQWFIAMDIPFAGHSLRQRALDEIKKVKWDPGWGEERLGNMLATRPDWCISRQRIWGVPIAVLLCAQCGQPLRSAAVNQKVVELFAARGADAWYEIKPEELLAGESCAECHGRAFRKEMDILDVWLEAGASQAAVLGREPDLPWPADLYTEGADQYRGWFQSSLLCALGTRQAAPYRSVVTSGWTLDSQGQAMSKSRGNVVDPVDIADRLGAEVVRLWVASVDFREDVRCSEDLMQRVAENYRKLRNTFRNLLANLYDFEPARDQVSVAEMFALDRYMLMLTADLCAEVERWFAEFAFHKIYQRLVQFSAVELSSFYFDVLKDRLYTFAASSRGRRSAQTALWRIAEALARLLAPLMSFTAEEVWQLLPAAKARESVHVARFPAREEILPQPPPQPQTFLAEWQTLLGLREAVLKALEEARQARTIGSSLEAQVRLTLPEAAFAVARRYAHDLRELFIVSAVELVPAPSENGAAAAPQVQVTRAAGRKCERCWNYSPHVGEDAAYPTVCERCSRTLAEIGDAAGA